MHGHGKEENVEGKVIIRGHPGYLCWTGSDGDQGTGGPGDSCAHEEGHMAPALSTPGGHPYHLRYLPSHMLSPLPPGQCYSKLSPGQRWGAGELDMVGYVKGQIKAQASKK